MTLCALLSPFTKDFVIAVKISVHCGFWMQLCLSQEDCHKNRKVHIEQ